MKRSNFFEVIGAITSGVFVGCLIWVMAVLVVFALPALHQSQQIPPEPIDQQSEAYKPKLYTVITRESTYENLKRAGSGEYETPEGKRIDFNEPYTEFEQ